MAFADRFRKAFDQAASRAVNALAVRSSGTALAGGPRELSLQARIPNPFGGEPLAQLRVRITTETQAHGETLRLRAHLKTQLAVSPEARAALPAPDRRTSDSHALAPRAQRMAQSLVRRGLATGLARRVTPYLERRFESWVDIQAATSPLDRGAQALMPESVQILGLDRAPVIRLGDEGQVETWVGRCTGDQPGVAQVTLLQFNERQSPKGRRGARKPLHVAASVATFYEDTRKRVR